MDIAAASDVEWEALLQLLIARTEKSGACVRYTSPAVTLVASRCQLEVDVQKILFVPPRTGRLGLGDTALEVVLPDGDHPLVGYYQFEDETGGIYLSVKYPVCGAHPEHLTTYAELELATNQELLDASANAPRIQ
jgi:hypothetical protein